MSKNSIIRINNNELFINNKRIIMTEENIQQVELSPDGGLIVLTAFPKRIKLSRGQLLNLAKYDLTGKEQWKVSYSEDLGDYAPISGFTIINESLSASDFYGRAFDINMMTGKATMDGVTK